MDITVSQTDFERLYISRAEYNALRAELAQAKGEIETLADKVDAEITKSTMLGRMLGSVTANLRDIRQYIEDDRIATAVEMLSAMIGSWEGEG